MININQLTRFLVSILLLSSFGISANSSTYTYTVAELDQYITESVGSQDNFSRLIGEELQTRLVDAGLELTEGSLLYATSIPGQSIDNSCSTDIETRTQHVQVTASGDTQFELIIDKLDQPITASIDLYANLEADGRLVIEYGGRVFGSCVEYASDSMNISASASAIMSITLNILLNPERIDLESGGIEIKVRPEVFLTGSVRSLDNVDVDFSGVDSLKVATYITGGLLGEIIYDELIGFAENYAEGYLTASELDSYYQSALGVQSRGLSRKVAEALLTSEEYANWNEGDDIEKSYIVPAYSEKLVEGIGSMVNSYSTIFPVSQDYISQHKNDLFYALLIGDSVSVKEILTTSLACQASSALTNNAPAMPLPEGTDFTVTSHSDFCSEITDNSGADIGNAASWSANDLDQLPWTLTPGTQFDIGVLSTNNNYQPYMQKNKYKNEQVGFSHPLWYGRDHFHPRGNGTCELEMRVYKKDIAATNLKPVMAIHGGSWQYRGFGFFGMESMISNLTEKGFVVFAPFYRLAGTSDGNIECNGATGPEMLEDIEDALSWVEQNMSEYGAEGKVHLFGQSAGAHFAGYLSTHHPERIERSLLMYPPTDLSYFVDQYNAGYAFMPNGVKALELFLNEMLSTGGDLTNVDTSDQFIIDNSFPAILQNAQNNPPIYMIHGKADALVPSDQSVRLCNGIAGSNDLNNGVTPSVGTYKETYKCGDESRLDVIVEADHVLDLCIEGVSCFTGSENSVNAARQSLNEAHYWLADEFAYPWLIPVLGLLH